MKKKLSIAIPTSDMPDKKIFFKRCLNSLWNQSFQDFDIIVTDNSEDDEIKNICEWFRTGIYYYKNPRKGMAQNTNEAIKRSTGELIKIIYMDDFMAHDNALKEIVDAFTGQWLVTTCKHTKSTTMSDKHFVNIHVPRYSEDINIGNNTIGSPSVLTIKNKDPLLFDEKMTWLLDCDYYHRMHEKYGLPTILDDVNVIIGLHPDQATHTMGEERKAQEAKYIKQKYA